MSGGRTVGIPAIVANEQITVFDIFVPRRPALFKFRKHPYLQSVAVAGDVESIDIKNAWVANRVTPPQP